MKRQPKKIAAFVVRNYNLAPHKALFGLSPADVTPETEFPLLKLKLETVALVVSKRRIHPPFKFSVGYKVRILSERKAFSKGFRGTYTEEVFKIVKRFRRKVRPDLNIYLIRDLLGEEVKGVFYEPELQRVEVDTSRVKKGIEKRQEKQTQTGAVTRFSG